MPGEHTDPIADSDSLGWHDRAPFSVDPRQSIRLRRYYMAAGTALLVVPWRVSVERRCDPALDRGVLHRVPHRLEPEIARSEPDAANDVRGHTHHAVGHGRRREPASRISADHRDDIHVRGSAALYPGAAAFRAFRSARRPRSHWIPVALPLRGTGSATRTAAVGGARADVAVVCDHGWLCQRAARTAAEEECKTEGGACTGGGERSESCRGAAHCSPGKLVL